MTEILGELQGAGKCSEGLAGRLYRKLGQFSLPFYSLKKVDAKAVEEMQEEKILSFHIPFLCINWRSFDVYIRVLNED